MNYFDFHCDTIGECYNQNKALLNNNLHIDLFRAKKSFNNYCQTFAVWIPDEKRGEPAYDYFNCVYECFLKEIGNNSNFITFCKNGSEVNEAFKNSKIAALLSVESGAALCGDINKLKMLYNKGVRLMTLTWNGQNELGYGCMCEDPDGLNDFGKTVVQGMQNIGMLVDVSHLSEKGFYDVVEITDKPFIATHSNCKIVNNQWAQKRNLSDAQVKIMIERKCAVGINLCADFLGDNKDNVKEAVLKHINHFLDLGAEDVLCFGADFDGCTVNDELSGIDKIYLIYDFLISKGFSEQIINKIFFDNANRFIVANI